MSMQGCLESRTDVYINFRKIRMYVDLMGNILFQVWYAAHYAHKMGVHTFEMSKEDQQSKHSRHC